MSVLVCCDQGLGAAPAPTAGAGTGTSASKGSPRMPVSLPLPSSGMPRAASICCFSPAASTCHQHLSRVLATPDTAQKGSYTMRSLETKYGCILGSITANAQAPAQCWPSEHRSFRKAASTLYGRRDAADVLRERC